MDLAGSLAAVEGIHSAYLFGSFAEGRSHRESDVDLGVLLSRAVYPNAPDRFDLRLRLTSRLSGQIGREVDLVVLNDAPPLLARRILTEGRRIILNDAEADHAFRRTMLSRAADLEPFLRRTRRVKLAALGR